MRGAWDVKSTQGDAAVAPAGEVNASVRLIETGRWRVGRHNAQRGWRPLCAHGGRSGNVGHFPKAAANQNIPKPFMGGKRISGGAGQHDVVNLRRRNIGGGPDRCRFGAHEIYSSNPIFGVAIPGSRSYIACKLWSLWHSGLE